MTTRPPDEDHRLRKDVNDLIAHYNEFAGQELAHGEFKRRVPKVREGLGDIWSTYFDNRTIYDSDADALAFMYAVPSRFWPEGMYREAGMRIAEFLRQPFIDRELESRLNDESRYLLEYSESATAQSGETGIARKVFELIGTENRWCVEFGAADGKFKSNTFELIMDDGWDGVLIEGDDNRFDELTANFAGIGRARLFNMLIGFERGHDTIEDVLERAGAPKDVDMMVIDIDGNDWHVWQSMETVRPRLLIVEFNPSIPNEVVFVQERDPSVKRGCSLRALVDLGKRKGYELICVTRFNAFFVPRDEFPKVGIEDNSIDAMFESWCLAHLFHAYDASIHIVGMPRLVWTIGGTGRDWAQNAPSQFVVYP